MERAAALAALEAKLDAIVESRNTFDVEAAIFLHRVARTVRDVPSELVEELVQRSGEYTPAKLAEHLTHYERWGAQIDDEDYDATNLIMGYLRILRRAADDRPGSEGSAP